MPRSSLCTSALMARLLCSAAVLLLPGTAHANPAGAQVVAGAAAVTQPSSTSTTITQQSEKAIIDWHSFSIGQGETTAFKQPDAKAITLNRVTGGDPSAILGNLTANGQVWLINPNGIAFGKSARVDVAGLLATTIDIANDDFMSGNYRFQSARDPNAMVTNAGQITIHDAGLAALVAPGVANSGVIEADLGQVQLSSATAFTVDLYGDGLFNIALDKQVTQAIRKSDGSAVTTAVENSGKLIADGGKVLLTANAAKSVVDHAIDMTGYIQATSASVAQNGDIVLDGGSEGTVAVSGTLDASGTGQGQTGGTAEITGQNIQLSSTANVNVSGDAGGGTAYIGGGEHGTGPLSNASTTSIAAGAAIHADAVTDGNGGSVVVWSDDKTAYQGNISAKGGAHSGDGGSAEVSSHGLLDFTGMADLRAPAGLMGSLLLDPENVTIASDGETPGLPATGDTTLTATGDDSRLSVAILESALALGNVIVSTGSSGSQAGDITVAANIGWTGNNSLSLSAYRNITINDGVTIVNTGAGDLSLVADSTGTGTGTVVFDGTGSADWSRSTGAVSIFYNPSDNPAGSQINTTSYTSPVDFSSAVRGQLTAYMLVNTAYDLQNMRNALSGAFAIGKDIDASETANFTSDNGIGFEPIGILTVNDPQAPFSGILDGQGHTVENLSIAGSLAANGFYLGLIAEIGSTGIVRNINLTNVTGQLTTSIGGDWIGTIAGVNFGTISKASANGSITIIGSGYDIGGLVGDNDGIIVESASSVEVTGRSYNELAYGGQGRLGGVAGINLGTIRLSFSTGVVDGAGTFDGSEIGGLVGINGGEISQSYALGSVTGNYSLAGALIGQDSGGYVDQTYATGVVSDDQSFRIGGLVAYASSSTITSSYWDIDSTNQMTSSAGLGLTTAELKSGLPTGFDPTIWQSVSTINNGYPSLKWQSVASASETLTVVNFGSPSSPPPPPSGECSPFLPCSPDNGGSSTPTTPNQLQTELDQFQTLPFLLQDNQPIYSPSFGVSEITPVLPVGYSVPTIPASVGERALSSLLSSPTAWRDVDTVISAFMYLKDVAHLSDIADPNLRNAMAAKLAGGQVYGYATTAFINVLADALEKDGVIPRDFSRSVFVSVMSTGSNMASLDLFGQVVGQSIAILEQIATLKNDGTNLANTLAAQGLTYVAALDEADRLRDQGQAGIADRIRNATQDSISATTSSLDSWAASSPWKTPSEVDYKWHIITVLITARELQNEGHAAAAAQEVENARQYATNLDDNVPVLGIFSFGFGSDYQNFFSTVAASFGFAGV